jgi:hypothetical protein
VFFVLGRPIARLDDAQQKSCYSAFVDSAKSGRGGGGRVPTRSIDVCKKARRDAVAEVVEAAPELDALPEFAFYKQLQFHRPKQAAELGLGGGATQGAGGGTEWDGAGSPSEAMGSLSVSTSLAGMLRDFADTKRLAMHIWNTAQRGVRVAGAGGGAGVRRQRPDLDEDWEAAAGGDDGQGGFRFREAAVDYDAFLLRIRDRRAGALRAEVQQECQAFLRRAPLLPTEQRGNELQARAPTRAPLLQRRVRGGRGAVTRRGAGRGARGAGADGAARGRAARAPSVRAGGAPPPPPALVLSGHAASLTPY